MANEYVLRNGIIILDGNQSAGKVLTSDANGSATWQSASGNGATVSGTINYVSKFTSDNVLGNSLIFDNGTNVGIGTTSSLYKLDVNGDVQIQSTLYVGSGALGTILAAGTNTDLRIRAVGSGGYLKLGANGLDVLTVTSDDNVGIGIVVPTVGTKLHVYRSINNFLYEVRVENPNTGTSAASSLIISNGTSGLEFGILGVNTTAWSGYGTLGDSFIRSGTGGRNVNFLTDPGNSGKFLFFSRLSPTIDAASPSFAIDGSKSGFNALPNANSIVYIKGGDNTSSNYSLKIESASASSLFNVRNDGVVNINNSNNTGLISIKAKNNNDSTHPFYIENTSPIVIFRISDVGNVYQNGTSILNVAGSVTNSVIDLFSASGNYTLGLTTTPYNGVTTTSGNVLFRANKGNFGSPSFGNIVFLNEPNDAVPFIFNVATGIAGFGTTTPTAKLHIIGSDNTSGTYSLKIDNSASAPLLYVRNDGFVGIGLTGPNYPLHVSGIVSSNTGYNIGATAGFTGTFSASGQIVTLIGGIVVSVV